MICWPRLRTRDFRRFGAGENWSLHFMPACHLIWQRRHAEQLALSQYHLFWCRTNWHLKSRTRWKTRQITDVARVIKTSRDNGQDGEWYPRYQELRDQMLIRNELCPYFRRFTVLGGPFQSESFSGCSDLASSGAKPFPLNDFMGTGRKHSRRSVNR